MWVVSRISRGQPRNGIGGEHATRGVRDSRVCSCCTGGGGEDSGWGAGEREEACALRRGPVGLSPCRQGAREEIGRGARARSPNATQHSLEVEFVCGGYVEDRTPKIQSMRSDLTHTIIMALLLLVVVAAANAAVATATAAAPTLLGDPALVQTEYGPVLGIVNMTSDFRAFRGVPFAASTGGAGRFRAPQAPQPWISARNASAYGPGCFQTLHNPDVPSVLSEDCLNINVWTPLPTSAPELLPTMVFFHGGSFIEGSNQGPFDMYDGHHFVLSRPVCIMAANYRLGALGFAVTDDLRGNFGLMDQVRHTHNPPPPSRLRCSGWCATRPPVAATPSG